MNPTELEPAEGGRQIGTRALRWGAVGAGIGGIIVWFPPSEAAVIIGFAGLAAAAGAAIDIARWLGFDGRAALVALLRRLES